MNLFLKIKNQNPFSKTNRNIKSKYKANFARIINNSLKILAKHSKSFFMVHSFLEPTLKYL